MVRCSDLNIDTGKSYFSIVETLYIYLIFIFSILIVILVQVLVIFLVCFCHFNSFCLMVFILFLVSHNNPDTGHRLRADGQINNVFLFCLSIFLPILNDPWLICCNKKPLSSTHRLMTYVCNFLVEIVPAVYQSVLG